jgi:hypothetical protein
MNGWRIAALVLGILAVLCLAWIAEETHYQACVERAVAQYPVDQAVSEGSDYGDVFNGGLEPGGNGKAQLNKRNVALAECSWP